MQESRWYSILFLLQEEPKRVYMEISYAKEKSAILRKHWRGENQYTQEHFSSKSPGAKPEMLVWEAGYISKEKGIVFLKKWEEVFCQEGYQIVSSQHKEWKPKKRIRLTSAERVRFDSITFSNLKQGNGIKKIVCGEEGGVRRGAPQKYTVKAADSIFRVRANGKLIQQFREFCKKKKLTQNQGFALLLSYVDEKNKNSLLYNDFHSRLEKADQLVAKQETNIQKLREELAAARASKERPKKVRAATLQNELLKLFFRKLPQPYISGESLDLCSDKESKQIFPDKAVYKFPEKEGVYLVHLDHVKYLVNSPGLLMYYGTTDSGDKLKFCRRDREGERYGLALWDSEYLVYDYPWGFAVVKMGEIAYIVGALPIIDLERIDDWYIDNKGTLKTVYEMDLEIMAEQQKEWENIPLEGEYGSDKEWTIKHDEKLTLDRRITDIEEDVAKGKRMK